MQQKKRALTFGMAGSFLALCTATALQLLWPHALRAVAFLPINILCGGGLDCMQSLSEYDLVIGVTILGTGGFLAGMFLAMLTEK